MARTQLQIVNSVLRRMREDTVANTTDSATSKLVAEFVADSYEEVMEEWEWEALKHRIHIDIVSGTSKYDVTRYAASGGGVRDSDNRVAKTDSELQFIPNSRTPQVWIYDDANDNSPTLPIYTTPEALREVKALDRDNTEPDAFFFAVYNEVDATGEVRKYVEVYPEPTEARVMEMIFWTQDDALAADGTTDSRTILVPDRPLIALALMYLLNERGEEIGEPGNVAERRYNRTLAVAKEKEITAYGRGDRYEWRRD